VTPEDIELVVGAWSPGNSKRERAEKFDAYAQAGIRYFWSIEFKRQVLVHAYELRAGHYRLVTTLRGGATGTIDAAPVPMTFDPASLDSRQR
jgi:Uma2 family endonuclease